MRDGSQARSAARPEERLEMVGRLFGDRLKLALEMRGERRREAADWRQQNDSSDGS